MAPRWPAKLHAAAYANDGTCFLLVGLFLLTVAFPESTATSVSILGDLALAELDTSGLADRNTRKAVIMVTLRSGWTWCNTQSVVRSLSTFASLSYRYLSRLVGRLTGAVYLACLVTASRELAQIYSLRHLKLSTNNQGIN